jgi:hypothetical protein
VKVCHHRIRLPDLGIGMSDRRGGRRINRRVKGQDAKRAQAVVGDELGLRIELSSGITLMDVSECEELGAENQDSAELRN